MKYAKLINGFPVYAPNPVLHNGYYIGNPPDSVYEAEGYKPVVFTEPPDPISETGWWMDTWSEDDEKITQGWTWYEPDEGE
jgi:hypothetical protein